jgi:hypothetical protein
LKCLRLAAGEQAEARHMTRDTSVVVIIIIINEAWAKQNAHERDDWSW